MSRKKKYKDPKGTIVGNPEESFDEEGNKISAKKEALKRLMKKRKES